jgi:ribonuclease P protein component
LLLWQTQRDAGPDAARSRVGITVSSRVGNAVVRNRVKRGVREFVRRSKTLLPGGDLVIIAKPSAATLAHDMLDRDLRRLLGRTVGR